MSNVTSSSNDQGRVGVESEKGLHGIVAWWPFQEMTSDQWHVWSGLHWIAGFKPHEKQVAELRSQIPMPGERFDEVMKELEHRGYLIRLSSGTLYLPDVRPKFMEHMASDFEEYDHE